MLQKPTERPTRLNEDDETSGKDNSSIIRLLKLELGFYLERLFTAQSRWLVGFYSKYYLDFPPRFSNNWLDGLVGRMFFT